MARSVGLVLLALLASAPALAAPSVEEALAGIREHEVQPRRIEVVCRRERVHPPDYVARRLWTDAARNGSDRWRNATVMDAEAKESYLLVDGDRFLHRSGSGELASVQCADGVFEYEAYPSESPITPCYATVAWINEDRPALGYAAAELRWLLLSGGDQTWSEYLSERRGVETADAEWRGEAAVVLTWNDFPEYAQYERLWFVPSRGWAAARWEWRDGETLLWSREVMEWQEIGGRQLPKRIRKESYDAPVAAMPIMRDQRSETVIESVDLAPDVSRVRFALGYGDLPPGTWIADFAHDEHYEIPYPGDGEGR